MDNPYMARCGIDCEACDYRERQGCPGCPATAGKPFWGECELALCCIKREHEHCGKCQEFPCPTLVKFAYDKEQGDQGERIRHLHSWNAKGYAHWCARKPKATEND